MRKSSKIPETFTPKERATIKLAQASFKMFLKYIFPRSFDGIKYRMADGKPHDFELGDIHYEWADIVENNPRTCILAPRGHLKSTVLNHAFCFWKMFSANQNIDGVVISFKDKLAEEHTKKLKKYIQNNYYCRFWQDRKPRAESVVDFDISFGEDNTWNGKVDPYGVLSNVRGLHPAWVCADDILTDINTSSNALSMEPKMIATIDQVFRQSIESLPDEHQPLIVIGTPQSYEDTLYKLKTNPLYAWFRFPAEFERDGKHCVLWPEKYDKARLRRTLIRLKDSAYQVEFLLIPFLAVNSFIPRQVIESCIDYDLQPFPLDEPFKVTGIQGIYGGMDIGKHVHPSHLSVGAMLNNGDIIQIYEEFLDSMNYNAQAKHIKRIIEHFDIKRFYYDASRSEMEDRDMTKRAIGVKFTLPTKVALALAVEHRFFAETDEPGIVLLNDKRQTDQISSVDKTLKAADTAGGHGDALWSVALMIRAAVDGPVTELLGNAQDVFTGYSRSQNLIKVGD